MANTHSSPVWDEVAAELAALETAALQTPPPPPPPTPEVSITAGSAVTEGGTVTFTVTASPAPAANLDVTVTITASGDHGAAAGTRTVTVPASGSATVTVATADDSADEPDGSVTAAVDAGSGYTVSAAQGAATVAVADDDPPPVEQDQPDPDQPDGADQVPLAACAGRPTLLISSPEASRSDASVDFEVSLSCIPASSPIILLSPVRDGRIGQNLFINLSADQTSTTVTVTIGNEHQLGLAVVWSSGLANRYAQGDVTYTD
ncbi:MAG: hypothetical protein OXM54_04490 [Acidimicrobiaceae bacterium]|nr:hypothetical protein [Acidimicrobiaceae bacterium]